MAARRASRPSRPSAEPAALPQSGMGGPLRLPAPQRTFDATRYEYPWQVGGIQTGSLDHPQPLGGQSSRIAFVDTGAGLRLTVALDRGGDIVAADYKGTNLAFFTPNGYKPPSPAYHTGEDWLEGWPGGLVTACGPEYIGGPRREDGKTTSLHGRHSSTPAAINAIRNPDRRTGSTAMSLDLVVRDTRFYGPVFELRRTISAVLGTPGFMIEDHITNLGDQPVAHHWLYHINLGYPLLDSGARFVYRGAATIWQPEMINATARQMERLKEVRPPQTDRTGNISDAILIDDIRGDGDGLNHVGLINPSLRIGLMISYPLAELPRLCNWQHFGPRGAYVSGIEPYRGSLVGTEADPHPAARRYLDPGQSASYHLRFLMLEGPEQLKTLKAHDGPLLPAQHNDPEL
ncbi:MAG: DUF4432 family protein [Phycisphaeraceae bacterium]|nr:DUF4432 family protein [Phycisphaeraceae bacterium]